MAVTEGRADRRTAAAQPAGPTGSPPAVGGPAADRRRVMTRALGVVLLAGGALKFAWLVLPHDPRADDAAVAATSALCVLCGALLLTLRRPVSDRVMNAAVAAITLDISLELYLTNAPTSDFAFFYVWVIPFAYFFFSARAAALHTAFVGVCFAAALIVLADQGAVGPEVSERDVTRWVIVVGTTTLVGLFVRRLARWLRDREILLRHGFDDAALGMAVVASPSLRFIEVNDAYCEILGRPREAVLGLSYEDVTHPDDHDILRKEAELAASRAGRGKQAFEKRIVRPDGEILLIACHTAVLRNVPGEPAYLFIQAEDITERRRNEEALARQATQQAAVARLGEVALREEELGDLIGEIIRTVTSTLDVPLAVVVEAAPGGRELVADFGGREGLIGRQPIRSDARSLAAFTLNADGPVLIEDLREEPRFSVSALLADRGAVSGVTVPIGGPRRPFGALGAFTTERRAFTRDEVTFLEAVGHVLADAIQRHRSEEATRHAALHDPLTGLPNRTLVLDRIDHALNVLRREHTTVAVLVLDLDRFKVINDSLGHAAGDQVLLAMAPRLREAVRPEDTVGRLGGDEFAVVCERVRGPHEATALAERISTAVSRAIEIESGEHFLSASIGIAVTTSPDDTPDSLLRDADAAMYRAKATGRGRFELFDQKMREQVLARLRTEIELRRALQRGDLRVHYQPIVDVESRDTVSVEALVRWKQDAANLTPPDAFIPVAEETGLITEVGLWVLREACDQVATWQRQFGVPLQLAVNASGRQIADPVFPAEVAGIARRSGLAPGTLGLEVTESVLIKDAESPIAVLARLREHGLRLLLDDFGTGYSSLLYLKRLPLDTLKVDRSFVQGLGTDPDDSAIVAAVIALAHNLGLDAVAEGVETDRQLELLRRLACRRAQGFLFTPPLPPEELTAFLAAHRAA